MSDGRKVFCIVTLGAGMALIAGVGLFAAFREDILAGLFVLGVISVAISICLNKE